MISGMKVISVLVLIFAFCPQQLRTIVAAIKNAGGKVRYTEIRRRGPHNLAQRRKRDRVAPVVVCAAENSQMKTYNFVTIWRVKAPIESVWNEIYHSSDWPAWWKGVESVVEMRKG